MGWIIIITVSIVVLLVNAMVHQERVRLWRKHQLLLVAKQKAQIDAKKRQAAQKIKNMLREKRQDSFVKGDDPATANGPAAATGAAATAAAAVAREMALAAAQADR